MQYGLTPLHLAGLNGRVDMANLLMHKKANVEAKDKVRHF